MAAMEFKLTGFGELAKRLNDLQLNVVDRIAKRAAVRAARIVVNAAKAKAATDTGLLQRSLHAVARVYRDSGIVYVAIGPRSSIRAILPRSAGDKRYPARRVQRLSRPIFYAHLVEGGTRPHALGRGAVLGRLAARAKQYARRQRGRLHPGTKAQPFLLPALRDNAAQVIAAVGRELWDGIRRETGR